ncbi:MAG: hypothetical protein LBI15_08135 [Dysgonamonadaceae bacterium]|jgi:hypothetical protein|nr:hypothetical protein [Dysgonamonadaceae bacterium]
MNVKRAISLSFLLLANIVMLAHAVVPHHYHENTGVCILLHCRDSNEAHRHENHHSQNHEHKGNTLSDECDIDIHAFAKSENNDCCSYINCDCEQILYTLILDRVSISSFDTKIPFQHKPYLISYHTKYVSQSLGLRAPPIV